MTRSRECLYQNVSSPLRKLKYTYSVKKIVICHPIRSWFKVGAMDLLEVKGLKTYFLTRRGAVKAVDDVSFNVAEGEVFGLAGESGCGKSTTALSIMKLVPPPGRILGGNIFFDGEDLVPLPEDKMKSIRWKGISIVFQGAMNALNPVLTVEKQIAEAIFAHESVTKDEVRDRVERLLGLVGIGGDRARDYPHQFSGGMRQRVMIAMALACNPKLLIADEAVTALDVIVQKQVLTVLRDLQRKLHLSMILITHDLSVIAQNCNKVAIMYAGKIVEYTDVTSLFKNPLHPYTQALIGAFPSIKGGKKSLMTVPGSPPSLLNPPECCRFYPRCRYSFDVCRKKAPMLVEAEKEHFVACHLVQ